MAVANTVQGDQNVQGIAYCTQVLPSQPCITDAMISANVNAPIAGSKVQHENPGAVSGVQLFGPTTTITALTQTLGIADAAGTLLSFKAWQEVQATGVDRTVTVDLQKSTGGGAYATVLSATIGFTNTSVIRVALQGTINPAAYVAGDIFRAVVTVAGAAGAQAQGLTIVLQVRENPN